MNLGTYLNDHLAGAEAGCHLIARLADEYPDGELGAFLRELLGEVRADKQTLQELVARVDGGPGRLKQTGGWLVAELGRLKLAFGSPERASLSLFEGLELLSLGILGKRALWTALEVLGRSMPALRGIDFRGLSARAVDQYERVEARRQLAVRAALTQ